MAPGASCCVVNCTNASHNWKGQKKNESLRFFRIPKVKTREGEHVKAVTERRRRAWVAAIRRTNITFEHSSDGFRVCSRHFHKGEPAYEMAETDPDWAPSLHLGHGSPVRQRRRLKPKAVPSVFHRVEPLSVPAQNRKSRAEKRPARLREIETKKRKVHTDAESGVKASQSTTSVPLIPNIVAPLKLLTTSNEASRTLAFSDAERQTVQISEQKKTSEPVHQRLLAFRVPVNSELYGKIRTADLRASGRAQEALQHFSMPITAATETERKPEESAGNSASSVGVGRVKREPEECATESTPGFHGTLRTPSLCGKGTPSACCTPGFHEVQVKFEPEECTADSNHHFQVVQVRSDFEPAESAADTDTPHFDVVRVKTEPEESATESTFSSDVVQVKLEPEESATESTSSFDVVQVKLEPEESISESTSSFDVVQVKFEPEESISESTSSFDVVQVKFEPEESTSESTSSFDVVQVKLEPQESISESTSSFDVVQVKLNPEESATENTSSFDDVQVKFEPEESTSESTSSFDVVQVKLEPQESISESTSSFYVVQVKLEPEESATENAPNVAQVNSEPAEVMEGEASRKHNLTMTCDTNNTFSHETASNGVHVNIKCEPEESVADTFEIEIA
ncbi:serine-rich adhesin for platelets-like isoform X1 [Littorina saxatilis]|uniref:serine-rich adhesin for platelets-like isoform X1 n=1 Tax=Littorina saxatilis TaxID=31220 RepID=UPI0038B57B93